MSASSATAFRSTPKARITITIPSSRALYPDYPLWRGLDFKYEYTNGRLAIDVINGSPLLREWVDDSEAAPADLDVLTHKDERDWSAVRAQYLLY